MNWDEVERLYKLQKQLEEKEAALNLAKHRIKVKDEEIKDLTEKISTLRGPVNGYIVGNVDFIERVMDDFEMEFGYEFIKIIDKDNDIGVAIARN